MLRHFPAVGAVGLALALSACGSDVPTVPEPEATEIPEELQGEAVTEIVAEDGAITGTPMAERVATIGLLNKRNNLAQDLEMKPGEARRVGNIIIRLSACERTAPWEMPKETGAFVQVLTRDSAEDSEWAKIFSGWLFKNSPSLNIVEHPVYDVWVKDCAMSFPGEDTPSRPPAAPAPSPAPSASAEESDSSDT